MKEPKIHHLNRLGDSDHSDAVGSRVRERGGDIERQRKREKMRLTKDKIDGRRIQSIGRVCERLPIGVHRNLIAF